jgi:four helix bundle protein
MVEGVDMRGSKKLVVGDVTLQAIGALRPLVDGIRRRNRALSEQLVRAMTNVALCISRAEFPVEGTPRGHLLAALASAGEAQAVLHVAIDCDYCTEQRAKPARALLDKTQTMLCQLARRK